jgi:hypothetical protein
LSPVLVFSAERERVSTLAAIVHST